MHLSRFPSFQTIIYVTQKNINSFAKCLVEYLLPGFFFYKFEQDVLHFLYQIIYFSSPRFYIYGFSRLPLSIFV